MKITLEVFEALRSSLGCHPGLLELISSMGNKSTPDDEHYMSSYSDVRSADPQTSSQTEVLSGTSDPHTFQEQFRADNLHLFRLVLFHTVL